MKRFNLISVCIAVLFLISSCSKEPSPDSPKKGEPQIVDLKSFDILKSSEEANFYSIDGDSAYYFKNDKEFMLWAKENDTLTYKKLVEIRELSQLAEEQKMIDSSDDLAISLFVTKNYESKISRKGVVTVLYRDYHYGGSSKTCVGMFPILGWMNDEASSMRNHGLAHVVLCTKTWWRGRNFAFGPTQINIPDFRYYGCDNDIRSIF